MKIGKKSSGTLRRRQDETVGPKVTAAKLCQCHVLTFISSGDPIISLCPMYDGLVNDKAVLKPRVLT